MRAPRRRRPRRVTEAFDRKRVSPLDLSAKAGAGSNARAVAQVLEKVLKPRLSGVWAVGGVSLWSIGGHSGAQPSPPQVGQQYEAMTGGSVDNRRRGGPSSSDVLSAVPWYMMKKPSRCLKACATKCNCSPCGLRRHEPHSLGISRRPTIAAASMRGGRVTWSTPPTRVADVASRSSRGTRRQSHARNGGASARVPSERILYSVFHWQMSIWYLSSLRTTCSPRTVRARLTPPWPVRLTADDDEVQDLLHLVGKSPIVRRVHRSIGGVRSGAREAMRA